MRMEMAHVIGEPELRRRARCVAYRIMSGELVVIRGDELWLPYLGEGIRVAPASAGGVIPSAL